MNIIKNRIQNRVRDDRLCLVIYAEKNIFIDIENTKIIQSIHNIKNHRK